MVFGRIRIRIRFDAPAGERYRITHPYGIDDIDADDNKGVAGRVQEGPLVHLHWREQPLPLHRPGRQAAGAGKGRALTIRVGRSPSGCGDGPGRPVGHLPAALRMQRRRIAFPAAHGTTPPRTGCKNGGPWRRGMGAGGCRR
ncbi:hypothetical protein [Couchioplanes caeruleus]|uniref:Uncharacterized protein n=1 Tax=Couchioplanes caeruleus subsp. caeruleus TaxID=56427 RepID=A0A1K0FA50_9ACTN|nr:hypothetical protein [Couchioplanes caeruleus]OJF09749.1 hypothetical protein BG844_35905 [Couchioplanes caeruleus subsp. caeruleus]